MGQPVVHFEVTGKDGEALRSYYSELFDWEIDANNPMNYGTISAEANKAEDGTGIGGGIGQAPEGMDSHVTFYVAVDDVEEALAKAESLGGTQDPRPVADHGHADPRPLPRPGGQHGRGDEAALGGAPAARAGP